MLCLNPLLRIRSLKNSGFSNILFLGLKRGFKRSIYRQENLVYKKDLEEMNTSENILRFYSRLFNMDQKEIQIFLPATLLWQILTHKTYFHGKYPYNEKLAFQGLVNWDLLITY